MERCVWIERFAQIRIDIPELYKKKYMSIYHLVTII